MERPQVTAAAIAAPCIARQTTSASMLCAAAPNTLAIVYSESPASSTGRRPKRSDSGPHTSWPRPKQMMSADSVSCVALRLAPSSRCSVGSAGRYRSVEIGWMPSSSVRVSTTTAGVMVVRSAEATGIREG
jgi:hypothetical protein